VRHRGANPAGHLFQTNLQIGFLLFKRGFQDPLEHLLVAELQRLLNGFVRIHGGQAGMLIFSTGEIAQRRHVREPGKLARDSRQCGQREVLDDTAVLLELREHLARLPCSEDGTF